MLYPASIPPHWPAREQLFFGGRSCIPAIETAPAPVFGPLHQLRSQSIAFHITAQSQKVVILLHGKRLESTLVKVTGPGRLAMRVPALCVSQRQPANKTRQFTVFLRPHNQVPVISHQTIRKQPCSGASDSFLKHPFKCGEVLILRKNRHPGVCAVQHMIHPTTRC